MSQLTIKLSDKADALIAQLQKEIFNRRRKKVSASGVVETLVESGAKSQSDKRFATSWKNLISDIEKAAKLANAHGSKPANLSDAEWALVLSHRARSTGTAKTAAKPAAKKAPATAKASAASKPAAKAKPKPAKAARNPVKKTAVKGTAVKSAAKAKPAAARSSVARRMAKAVSRLNTAAPAAVSSNGAGQLTTVS
jgi:ATP-dependent Clp protease ATP-binding subunit ClpA